MPSCGPALVPWLCRSRRGFGLRARHVGVDFLHVQGLDGVDDLLELRGVQRAGLGEDQHLLAEGHQRGDGRDAGLRGELLLGFGVHLGEDDVGCFSDTARVRGRELAARPAPFGPEVHQDNVVALDGRCELFTCDVNGSHGSTVREPCPDVPRPGALFASRVIGNILLQPCAAQARLLDPRARGHPQCTRCTVLWRCTVLYGGALTHIGENKCPLPEKQVFPTRAVPVRAPYTRIRLGPAR